MEGVTIPTPDELLEINRERFGEEIDDLIRHIVDVLRDSFLTEEMEINLAVDCNNSAVLQAVGKRFEKRGWSAHHWLDEETAQYYMVFAKPQPEEEEEEEDGEGDEAVDEPNSVASVL